MMRKEVQKIYDRQVFRCLRDIEELDYKIPSMVLERFKRAIEYSIKDTDKLNNTGDRDGTARQEYNGNR